MTLSHLQRFLARCDCNHRSARFNGCLCDDRTSMSVSVRFNDRDQVDIISEPFLHSSRVVSYRCLIDFYDRRAKSFTTFYHVHSSFQQAGHSINTTCAAATCSVCVIETNPATSSSENRRNGRPDASFKTSIC